MYIEKLLHKIWLNDNQIAIYLKCLQYGKVSASAVASSLGRERTSTLKLMQSMVDSGYLSESKFGITNYFNPIPFSILQEQFERQHHESSQLLEQKDLIHNELLLLTNPSPDITCKIQDGENGVRYMYQTILHIIHSQNIHHISCIADNTFESKSSFDTKLSHITQDFTEQLKQNKITVISYLGKGISIMEQLIREKNLNQIPNYSNSNGSSQLWIVGSDIFIAIFKKNPQVVHLHNKALANLMHFITNQLDMIV